MLNIKKDGYTFEGWFTDEEGTKGNEFSFDDIINNDTKIYAKWNPITYATIIENTNGGLLEVNEDEPIKGQRIVITVKADEGKIVDIITIVDEDGNAIELTDNGDGTYSYIQPDSKVTIKATYKDKTSYNEKDENIADKEQDNDIANKGDNEIKEPAETGDNSYYSIWILMVLFFGVSFITINSRKRA